MGVNTFISDSVFLSYTVTLIDSTFAVEDATMLTVNEIAKELGLKPPTIRLWVAQRKVAHFKLGRAVRIPRSELERLMKESLIPARDQRDRRFT